MKSWLLILGLLCGLSRCANAPGAHAPDDESVIPSEVSDFTVLYEQNCAGCHGSQGKGGAAIALGNPVYLAIADDTVLRCVATVGISGTSMPAFARSAGGILTDKQIDVIVRGIRARWSDPGVLRGAIPPPHFASESGDAARGLEVYGTYCVSCHGPRGRGGQKAG